jgi:hypothetical protein
MQRKASTTALLEEMESNKGNVKFYALEILLNNQSTYKRLSIKTDEGSTTNISIIMPAAKQNYTKFFNTKL